MSVMTTYTRVGLADRDGRRTTRETPPPSRRAPRPSVASRPLLVVGEPLVVDEFIAGVLDRAHRAASAHGAPDEARVILGLAQLFADELAKTNVRFDRLRFIEEAIEEQA